MKTNQILVSIKNENSLKNKPQSQTMLALTTTCCILSRKKTKIQKNNHNHNSSSLLPNLLPLNVYVKCFTFFLTLTFVLYL